MDQQAEGGMSYSGIGAGELIVAESVRQAISNPVVTATGATNQRFAADRFADTLSPLDFGAAGDGVYDDTAALSACITAAGTTAAIVIDRPHVIKTPSDVVFPAGGQVVFRGSGRLITSFGSLQSVRMDGWGSGATSVPSVSISGDATLGTVRMGLSTFLLADPGTGYEPGDELVLPVVDTSDTPARLVVWSTQVVSATIVSAGSGGTDGSATVYGTTGRGILCQIDVTISGGAIASVDVVALGGNYEILPDDIANEPVVGPDSAGAGYGLTGAVLSLVMGVGEVVQGVTVGVPSVYVSNFGLYTDLPTGTLSLSGGSGTGAQIDTVTWNLQSIAVTDGGAYTGTAEPTFTITGGGFVVEPTAVAVGEMIEINGNILAGGLQVFSGYGYVTGAPQVAQVEAAWFGAIPGADIGAAMARLGHAVPEHGVAHLGAGEFTWTCGLRRLCRLKSNVRLYGEGAATRIVHAGPFSGTAYVFPYADVPGYLIANENWKAPFHPTTKVDEGIVVERLTFDGYDQQSSNARGSQAVFIRMAQHCEYRDLRLWFVTQGPAYLACSECKHIRTWVRGGNNAGADNWENPTNIEVVDIDVDHTGVLVGNGLYGVLFTAADTATRYGRASGLRLRGGRVAGIGTSGAAVWCQAFDYGMTCNDVLIDGIEIDQGYHATAIGIYFTGPGRNGQILNVRGRRSARPIVFLASANGGSPSDVLISNVKIEDYDAANASSPSTSAPIVIIAGTRTDAPPTLARVVVDAVVITYAEGATKPNYSISISGGADMMFSGGNNIAPGATGVLSTETANNIIRQFADFDAGVWDFRADSGAVFRGVSGKIAQFEDRGTTHQNWWMFRGGATNDPLIARVEGETNASLGMQYKGTGNFRVRDGNGANRFTVATTATQLGLASSSGVGLQVTPTAAGVNFATFESGTAGNKARLHMDNASDATAGLAIDARSSGVLALGGAANALGFFASAGAVKATVSGSRGGNAALESLLTALAAYGLITDSTS